ncbi:single-stranded DNA-binding protein [Pseudobacteriovorax antillogorgiicola]|uniref:Single-stranded DNA-binding protein n=1 Tax=Pseudobacteriovorax antillogorgiicola TaxID=1513793 RepID=A0A1Y6CNJ9_9BACT|nr:single-stranded DNA-binding protein [Pseudobacteriovorax antillogorgiicola]TCS46675.1 single-strand binding protein [Pseudobacteriovorax antillogorgiicola]SMF66662.1 single-strand DNA-binding protein [Pseudobacteriovorax antillogorgiicola]
MASVNKAIILGNLGQDPELKYTPSGTAVCTLSVATTDVRNDPNGGRQERTEWHRVVVWSKQAENCAKYLSKGRSVYVEGRIQTRSWEDQSGQKRYSTEVVAQTVQFIGGGASSRNNEYSSQPSGGYQQQNKSNFTPPPADPSPADHSFGGPDTASLDDIPF